MANRYWRGGTGTWDTTTTTNWSTTSGGAGGASVPTAADSVFFDQAGTYSVTTTGALTCLDITVSAGTVSFLTGSLPSLAISGSMSLVTGTVWSTSAGITFNATATGKTITTNGTSIATAAIVFNGAGGGWTLGSALTTGNSVTLTNGTFSTGNFAVSVLSFINSGTGTTSLSLGSSTVTYSSNWNFSTTTGLTFSAGTSTITSGAANPVFSGGGLTYNNVSFTYAGSGGSPSITGANTFANLTFSGGSAGSNWIRRISVTNNQTVTGTFTATGLTYVRRTSVFSATPGTSVTITAAAISVSYVDFQDITAAGAAGTWSGTSIGDCGGNSNITFTTAKTVYWNLAGAQDWSATGWATSSGGTPAVANFPLAQDTAVFDNTGSVTGAITISDAWNIGTINMSARTSAMTLTISAGASFYGSWSNGTGTTLSSSAFGITFSGRTVQQITSNGIAFDQPIIIDNVTGTFQLQDALTTGTTRTATFTSGTLDLNGKTLTTGLFSSNNANTRTLAFGAGNIACVGTGTVWTTATVTGLTVTGTPVVNVTSTGATAITVNPGALSETNAISFNFTGGTYALTFLSSASPGSADNVDFTGYAGTWGITGASTIYGNLTLSTGMTLTASNSVMTFGATNVTQTITSNGKTMDFPLTKSGAGTLVGADALTLGSTRALTFSLGTIQLKAGATSTVGSFVTSGTTPKYLLSTTAGTQATISDASGTNSPTYLYIKDSAATGGATWSAAGTSVVNGGNNTGWTSLPTQAPFLIGVSAAGSVGTVGFSRSFSLSGVSAAGNVGSVIATKSFSKALTGVAAAGSVGTVTTSQAFSKTITGVQAAGTVGTVTTSQAVSKTLTGVAATGNVGTATTSQEVSKTLTGVEAAGFVGAVIGAPTITVLTTGVEASGVVGTVTTSQTVSKTLTSVSATGSVGTVTTSQEVSQTITGVVATGSIGTVTTSQAVSQTITGVEASGVVGAVTASQEVSKTLTGVAATGSLGTIIAIPGTVLFISGVSAQGNVSSVTAAYYLTGVRASGAVGTITTSQVISKTVAGNQALGGVGLVTTSQQVTLELIGVSASGELGVVIPVGWFNIDNAQTSNWGIINNAQTGTWTLANNAQTSNWGIINNAQTGTWAVIDNAQANTWQLIDNATL